MCYSRNELLRFIFDGALLLRCARFPVVVWVGLSKSGFRLVVFFGYSLVSCFFVSVSPLRASASNALNSFFLSSVFVDGCPGRRYGNLVISARVSRRHGQGQGRRQRLRRAARRPRRDHDRAHVSARVQRLGDRSQRSQRPCRLWLRCERKESRRCRSIPSSADRCSCIFAIWLSLVEPHSGQRSRVFKPSRSKVR